MTANKTSTWTFSRFLFCFVSKRRIATFQNEGNSNIEWLSEQQVVILLATNQRQRRPTARRILKGAMSYGRSFYDYFLFMLKTLKTRRLFRRRYFFGHLILSYIPAISLQLDQFYFSCFIFQFFFHRNFGELHRGNEPKNGWKFRLQFLTLMIKCIYQEALVNTCIKVLKF